MKQIVIDCKYYLPCGICDKTNGFCSQLGGIVMPVKPDETVQFSDGSTGILSRLADMRGEEE